MWTLWPGVACEQWLEESVYIIMLVVFRYIIQIGNQIIVLMITNIKVIFEMSSVYLCFEV